MYSDYYDSTPESRKNWIHDTWFDAVSCCRDLLEARDCPDFSAEEWKNLILADPVICQYCPFGNEVKELLTAGELSFWTSRDICDALAYDGDFLAGLLDLSKIEQQDFEDVFGVPEDFPSLEEYLEVTGGYFPGNKIPSHLNTGNAQGRN